MCAGTWAGTCNCCWMRGTCPGWRRGCAGCRCRSWSTIWAISRPRWGAASPGFQALLSLARDGAWVKLSGAYRLSDAPWADTVPLAQALFDAAPDRCVWGSDRLHVAHWAPMMNVGALLDLLAD